jgi:Holliday junction resolvasome RuvABC endonuclease subunit
MTATLFTDPRPRTKAAPKPPPAPIFGPLAVGSIVLALDPSSTCTGWAVLEKVSAGSVRIASGNIYPKSSGDNQKLDDLAVKVSALATGMFVLNKVERRPTDAAIEIPWGGRGGVPLTIYCRAVGVCEAACAIAGLSMNRIKASEWHQNYKQRGMDSKQAAMFWTRQIFGYAPSEHNEADAILVGDWICGRKI